MNRIPCIVVKCIAAGLSLAAAILLMMPVEFLRMQDNKSMNIRIDWSNLVCKIPTPNLDVSDHQLYELWGLSENVRLSERMIKAGRCAVAVMKYNEKSATKLDSSICYCANNWWVPTLAIVLLIGALVSFFGAINQFAKKRQPFTREEFGRDTCWAIVRAFFYLVILLVCYFNTTNEFSYTQYGDLFPVDYFNTEPCQWMVALYLLIASITVQTFFTCALNCCVKIPAANETSKKDVKPIENNKKAVEVKRPSVTQIAVETECTSKKSCCVFEKIPAPAVSVKKPEPSTSVPPPPPNVKPADVKYERIRIPETSESEPESTIDDGDEIFEPESIIVPSKEEKNVAQLVPISIDGNQIEKEKSIVVEEKEKKEESDKKEDGDVKKDG